MLQHRIAVIGVLCITCTGVVSCSSNDKPTAVRTVTSRQAQAFAQAAKNNYDDKNAHFVVTSASAKTQTFTAQGSVDWVNKFVSQDVRLNGEKNNGVIAVTTPDTVFEKYEGLAEKEQAAGLTPRTWVTRVKNSEAYGMDKIAEIVSGVASSTQDNPVLVKQDGAHFLGTKKIGGKVANAFRTKGGSITYYVTDDGVMVGLETQPNGFTQPITITFDRRGASPVTEPSADDAYILSQVSSFYLASRPKV